MASSQTAKQSVQKFVFADNQIARLVCGTNDANLALIEQSLSIDIYMRGNLLQLKGTLENTALGYEVLKRLVHLVEKGHIPDAAETEGVLAVIKGQGVLQDTQDDASSTPKKQDNRRVQRAQNKGRAMSVQSVPNYKAQQKDTASQAGFAQISTPKKTIYARTPRQNAYITAMQKAQLVFGMGPAGTGKTYLAVAYAASLLEAGLVERIILSRPAVEAGERLGFLPGDMKEKVDPYLRPLYDALYDMMPAEKVERALLAGIIEIAPLAFMRGRTLAHSAIILDEAQNTTSMQMKMLLTRLGEGSHMVINGDPSQIDLLPGQSSGLIEATELLHAIKDVAMVRFTDKDVVRHPLVAAIIRAYAQKSANQQANLLTPQQDADLTEEIKAERDSK